jgi:alpha/beta superfamily hydrolase
MRPTAHIGMPERSSAFPLNGAGVYAAGNPGLAAVTWQRFGSVAFASLIMMFGRARSAVQCCTSELAARRLYPKIQWESLHFQPAKPPWTGVQIGHPDLDQIGQRFEAHAALQHANEVVAGEAHLFTRLHQSLKSHQTRIHCATRRVPRSTDNTSRFSSRRAPR